ncbi:hypothetical protein A2U01_0006231, partial [Trifolium medium]|nr:hypothetical protein [Trifolium medium]
EKLANRQMGFRVLAALCLLMFLNLSSSYPIKNILPSVECTSTEEGSTVIVLISRQWDVYDSLKFVQKSKLEDKTIYGSKMEGGGVHGGGGHGGQSHGGGAVIPVYAAGAANKNHQPQSHHGAADCNLDKIKNSSMLMIVFGYPLMMLFLLT